MRTIVLIPRASVQRLPADAWHVCKPVRAAPARMLDVSTACRRRCTWRAWLLMRLGARHTLRLPLIAHDTRGWHHVRYYCTVVVAQCSVCYNVFRKPTTSKNSSKQCKPSRMTVLDWVLTPNSSSRLKTPVKTPTAFAPPSSAAKMSCGVSPTW